MDVMYWTFPHIGGKWKVVNKDTLECGVGRYHVKKWDGMIPIVPGDTLASMHDEYRGTLWKDTAVQEGVSYTPKENVWGTQVGGTHYTDMKIQPFQYSMANGLDPMQHTIVKYVSRFRAKGGIVDLQKAKQTIDLLIAFEQEKLNATQK